MLYSALVVPKVFREHAFLLTIFLGWVVVLGACTTFGWIPTKQYYCLIINIEIYNMLMCAACVNWHKPIKVACQSAASSFVNNPINQSLLAISIE